jgi:hypothetical protein
MEKDGVMTTKPGRLMIENMEVSQMSRYLR